MDVQLLFKPHAIQIGCHFLQIKHKFIAVIVNGLFELVKWILQGEICVQLIDVKQVLVQIHVRARLCHNKKLRACNALIAFQYEGR